jgi:hypothetical protein
VGNFAQAKEFVMENIIFPLIFLYIQDFRHISPQGESWGGYKPLFINGLVEVNFDLVTYEGVDVLL